MKPGKTKDGREQIATVILAGGCGARIGGDKALCVLQGRPLLDWMLEIVLLQSDEVLISANGDPTQYARRGCRVIADRIAGNAGPLAGLQAAMTAAEREWIACVPCDAPFLPRDLIVRLCDAMNDNTEAVVAVAAGSRQPAVALYCRSTLPGLDGYLTDGGRKLAAWQDTLRLAEVRFDDAAAYTNLNTAQELALAERILNEGGTHDDIRRAIAQGGTGLDQ